MVVVELEALRASDPGVLARIERACELLARALGSDLGWTPLPPASSPSGAPAEARVSLPRPSKRRPS